MIHWVKHGDKERSEYLPRLLQYVRMPLLSAKYITDVIDDEVCFKSGWEKQTPPDVTVNIIVQFLVS